MHVRVLPPAVAKALRDTFRLQGLVSLVHGVVEVDDPRAASDRDARLAHERDRQVDDAFPKPTPS